MKIDIIETHIKADAMELRENQTLAGNLTALLKRCFQSREPFYDDIEEEDEEEKE